MKKLSTVAALLLVSNAAFALDFSSFADKLLNTQTAPKTHSTSNLSDSVVRDGLKQALKIGVDYGVKELSAKNGYLNNKNAKIPLPENLSKAESLIRKVGGQKVADNLIESMNNAATEAAPKTASIFVDALEKMSIDDAKKILAGGDNAATNYFENKTSAALTAMIKPIVVQSMKENNVAQYYDTLNSLYKTDFKAGVENSEVIGMAKSFGLDGYLPSSSDENIDDYVTKKAISGLFTMIASKESAIRKNPVEQTTSLLQTVFGVKN